MNRSRHFAGREDATSRVGVLHHHSDEVTAEQLENSEVAGTASNARGASRRSACTGLSFQCCGRVPLCCQTLRWGKLPTVLLHP